MRNELASTVRIRDRRARVVGVGACWSTRDAAERRPGLAAAVRRLVHHLARALGKIDRLQDVEVEGVFHVAARVARGEFDVDDVPVLPVVRVHFSVRLPTIFSYWPTSGPRVAAESRRLRPRGVDLDPGDARLGERSRQYGAGGERDERFGFHDGVPNRVSCGQSWPRRSRRRRRDCGLKCRSALSLYRDFLREIDFLFAPRACDHCTPISRIGDTGTPPSRRTIARGRCDRARRQAHCRSGVRGGCSRRSKKASPTSTITRHHSGRRDPLTSSQSPRRKTPRRPSGRQRLVPCSIRQSSKPGSRVSVC